MDDLIETAPVMEIEAAPDDLQEIAPQPVKETKRRGRPPGSGGERKPRVSRASRKSLKDQIGGTLTLINLAFAFMPDPWRGDMLDDYEIASLATALDDTARANPTVHKYLSAVLVNGGAGANLVMVAAVITARRLARHGVIASEFDARLAVFIGGTSDAAIAGE